MNEGWLGPWETPMRSIVRGWKVRLVASVSLLVGGFVGLILDLAFLGSRFTWYQNLAVVLSTILVVPVVVVMIWVLWGIEVARRTHLWFTEPFDH